MATTLIWFSVIRDFTRRVPRPAHTDQGGVVSAEDVVVHPRESQHWTDKTAGEADPIELVEALQQW